MLQEELIALTLCPGPPSFLSTGPGSSCVSKKRVHPFNFTGEKSSH